MTAAQLDRWREVFEVPDAAELGNQAVQDPPAGSSSWLDWAKDRWPSLSTAEGEAG
jgi:hypothetical protein